MTTFSTTKFAAVTFAMAMAAVAGCTNFGQRSAEDTSGSFSTQPEAVAASADGSAIDQQVLDRSLELLDDAYQRIDGAWPGFDPPEHPVVLAWKNGDKLLAAVTINHPDPGALGDATEVQHGRSNLGRVHIVDGMTPEVAERLENLVNFEFDTEIGGAGSFLMEADTADGFFDPVTLDYGSTLLHEMFHRYQGLKPEVFTGEGFQDVDGYAYTADNIELAALEDRALRAALSADSEDGRREAARHVAALRQARMTADDRVVLDQDQELNEGSARYIEHLLGGDDTNYTFHQTNYELDLADTPTELGPVKDHYGFGRFYASGAAMYRLLDLLGHNAAALTEASGEPPANLLAEALGVSDGDVDSLVDEAKARYDADDELSDLAADAERQAADEPSPFAEDDDGGGGDGLVEGDGDIIEITDEQADCLERELGDGEQTVPDDIWDLCVGSR